MKIAYSDLEDAYLFVSSTGYGENKALICKDTGKIYYHSNWYSEEENDELFDNPDEDCSEFIEVPHKYDLDLGQELIFDFVDEYIPDDYGRVRDMFRRRGAYSRFKDFLERRKMLDAWYDYENERTEKALREWCEEMDIELAD
jgi:hypothetical protein